MTFPLTSTTNPFLSQPAKAVESSITGEGSPGKSGSPFSGWLHMAADEDGLTSTSVPAEKPAEQALGSIPDGLFDLELAIGALPEAGDAAAMAPGDTPLPDLVDALLGLDAAIASGQPPAPALLEKLSTAVQATSDWLRGSGAVGLPQETLLALGNKIGELAKEIGGGDGELKGGLLGLAGKLHASGLNSSAVEKLGLEPVGTGADAELAERIKTLLDTQPAKPLTSSPEPMQAAKLPLPDLGEGVVERQSAAGHASMLPEGDAADPTDKKTRHKESVAETTSPGEKPFGRPISSGTELTRVRDADIVANPTTETAAEPLLGGSSSSPAPAVRLGEIGAPRAAAALYAGQHAQLNVPQLAFDMLRQVQAGHSQFHIRLDPAELGGIEVKLDIDATGLAHARLVVEKTETLDLLQRDHRSLERALQQAGLETSKNSLEFSLRQGTGGEREPGTQNPIFRGRQGPDFETLPDPAVVRHAYRGAASAGGVNIFA